MAKTYAYAIVHDGAGSCLVFKKNQQSHFYQGALVPAAVAPNGAGSYCFPGGAVEAKDGGNLCNAAVREFLEETGENLGAPGVVLQAQVVSKTQYHGVFMQVNSLDAVQAACQKNLDAANVPSIDAAGIAASKVRDNELSASVQKVTFAVALARLFAQGDSDTGWFYDLVSDRGTVGVV